MLAGCSSSTLLSPTHRLRSEASAQFQACHFQLPSMSTQRLDLPCSFPRKDGSSRSQQTLRPVGVSVEKSEVKNSNNSSSNCSLQQNIRLPPLATTAHTLAEVKDEEFWEKGGRSLKRLAEHGSLDESFTNRVKRKKGNSGDENFDEFERESFSLAQFGAGNFWSVHGFGGFNSPSLPFSLNCSGDEERVCFAPAEVVSAPLPLSNNPWLESAVTKITNFGEGSHQHQHHHVNEGSVSNGSSESQSLSLRLNENASEHEDGNGSGNPYQHEGTEVETGEEDEEEEHRGFELLSLLTGCVDAIGSRNVAAINHFIAKLGDLASPRGTCISRICAYYTEALAIRVTRLWPHVFQITATTRDFDRVVDDDEMITALRLLNQVTPIPKFLHFTSNEMLLRAFEGKERVHIIDFDIKQGLQWPSLFQSLASRTNPPSHVRITGVGESKQELNETGDRLAGFAEALNLPFEFHPVVDRLEDVRLWMLHVKEHETVAVNCVMQLHKILYDGSGGALRDFLGLIRSTNPTMVVMAEQEAEHNEARLDSRVCNSLKYYSALFDSIDHSGLPLESPMRIKIEEMFAREIRNIIACEGRDRLERHRSFGNWRKMMVEHGGFRCMGVTDREMIQSQFLLRMYSCDNYSVQKQEQEGATALTLGWLDQPLYTVSSWAPVDAAGSSSSFSQAA
ncbi:SCARECROW-like protein 28-like [Trifolium pratense]|uniref:SCARECROW-like protein 28-like n=1 Tax=Trifolium pratense TaxID=57577 RepID=A0A2K3PC15_TRIPR|nr:scarecrow-like protein 28 [Trifolium pratense]PNY12833.1 SCARECROW-like protein 28-like [Trifolium pratense]